MVRQRVVAFGAVLFGICSLAGAASAQEWVGTEVSAAVPGVVLGSSSTSMVHVEGFDAFERGARYASCDPARGEYCAGMHFTGIDMNTFPVMELNLHLPSDFTIEGHLWSMEHDQVRMELRQAVVGTTLRRTRGEHWYELGVGMAERSTGKNVSNDPRGVECNPGPIEPAVLAGMGTTLVVDHVELDLRLKAGAAVGESADVYHANFVVGFDWR